MPSKEKFYSSLADRKISEKKYEHVLNVWKKFEMKTMKDYHDLYLKCDVLLLADVFKKFRNNSWKNYGLCPTQCLRAPCLSWNTMLKMTKIELQLVPDPAMYIFFEKGTRGISYSSDRYRYLKSYDPKRESEHIIYLNANNSFGYSMSKFLLTSGFKWIDPKKYVSLIILLNIQDQLQELILLSYCYYTWINILATV